MQQIRLAVRQLVEFLLQTGDIDSRFAGFDRANEGARIHRKLQKQAGEGYQPEVFLSGSREVDGIRCTVEGRADGIFTDSEGRTVIDEIKTTGVPSGEISAGLNFCHWAQGMVYAALYAAQQDLPEAAVRLTYYQIDDDKIFYFTRYFSAMNWKISSSGCCGSTPPGPAASWTGTRPAPPVCRPCASPMRATGRGSAPWRARSTGPVKRDGKPEKAVSGCSARRPPAPAKP